jgi:beta-phosphoglucomutase
MMEMSRAVGFIWDIDGVVLDSPHEESWRLTAQNEPWNIDNLTTDFYFTHVASRSRYEGAHNILELLGVYERLGARTSESKRSLMERYAAEKDSLTKKMIGRGEFKLFEDAVTLLLKARRAGVLQAAASASKNASTMLRNVSRSRVLEEVGGDFGAMSEADSLYSMFDFDGCGVEFDSKVGILRYAAEGLQKLVDGAMKRFCVFEDAPSGLEAARLLGYHAVGIFRIGKIKALEETGADLVTDDLGGVSLEDLLALK